MKLMQQEPPFIHPLSDCQTNNIGAGTRIWQFTVILEGAQIGVQCNICSHVLIESKVIIGSQVTIKSGVQIWDHTFINDNVFIGPNVSFCNDLHPRSKKTPDKFLTTTIERGASIGSGAVILPGITIGSEAMIGAGAVVTRDVPSQATVVGNPGKIIKIKNRRHN
jgi:UDP-2-acetamido-3-amino-2,3-dideoxy-glucuronate N-acetyltransferase